MHVQCPSPPSVITALTAEPRTDTETGGAASGRTCWSWAVGQQQTLQFSSDAGLSLQRRQIRHLAAHLPGFQEQHNPCDPVLTKVEHSQGEKTTIAQQPGQIGVNGPLSDVFPGTLPHLLYGCCRLEWIRQKNYPVHAACIGDAENGYCLLAGPSGSGKTSLVMEHARRHRPLGDRQIYSADKTLVRFSADGKLKAVAGTRTISVRNDDMSRWEAINKEDQSQAADRTLFQLAPDCYTQEKEVDISRIFLVTLNDRPKRTKLPAASARHQLFPLFLDKQREDVLIGDHSAVLDGTVPLESRSYLARCLQKSLATLPAEQLQGSLAEVYSQVMPGLSHPLQALLPLPAKKILFGICGIGNGHLNRQLPCLRELLQAGHRIMVFTYGQGLSHFREKKNDDPHLTVCAVKNPYIVGCKRGLDFAASSQVEGNNCAGFNAPNFTAMATAHRLFGRPDLVVSDYEQVAAQYAYSQDAPLVTLDQQSKFLIGEFPEELAGTSCKDEQERLSMFFPHARKRVAVSFFQTKTKGTAHRAGRQYQVTLVPPVLRTFIADAAQKGGQTATEASNVLFYVTSQSWQTLPIERWIHVVEAGTPDHMTVSVFLPRGCELPADSARMKFFTHGDDRFDGMLASCRGLISTAGHGLLSEAMALAKPVYAIPLPLYEQQMNAKVVGDNQFGMAVSEPSTETLQTFHKKLDRYAENIRTDREILLRGCGKRTILNFFDQILREPS